MNDSNRSNLIRWYIALAVIGVLLMRGFYEDFRRVEPLPYSDFLAQIQADNVREVRITGDRIEGHLKKALPDGRAEFSTTRVDDGLSELLSKHNVRFTGIIESTFLKDILGWIVPVIFFMAVWMFLMRRMASQGGPGGTGFMAIGKSKARVYVEKDIRVTFADVAGVDEAKEELQEVIGFLRNPAVYGRLGGRVPHGILLVGPPGTGKTLLARAVAGEAGVPFFSINGSEFVEMFVGVGAARVRDLFEQARAQAPAIIFIDEIDALGKARGAAGGFGGHDEKEQTLNQLLAELDGFDSASGLVLLAATNRPEILDPALLRAGRFDRQILVDRPDKAGRIQILGVHLKKIRMSPNTDVEQIAALTAGFSGADLANLVNEAALLATRRNHDAVTLDDFTGGIERIVAGLEKKNRLINPLEREIVAWHEMGHALVAIELPGTDVVHKVSIIPRGIGALGYTINRPTEDRYLMSQEELENKMAVLLGGRAAERLHFGRVTTGAADDLVRATDIARSMVTRYGMSKKLGQIAYENTRNTFLARAGDMPEFRNYSEQTAKEIDDEVRAIINEAFMKATDVLTKKHDALLAGARALLEKETLTEEEVLAIAKGRTYVPPPALGKPGDAGDDVVIG